MIGRGPTGPRTKESSVDEQHGADPGTLGLEDPWRGIPATERGAPKVPRVRTAEETGGGFGGAVPEAAAGAARGFDEAGADRGDGNDRAGGTSWAGENGRAGGTSWAGENGRADPDGAVAERHRRAELYLEVQHSPAFAEVRDRYRGFVFPVAAGFLAWYLLYVVAATTAPGLMGRRVVGQLNVALVAGLAQFATTFLLTWAYARHARLRRDQAALDLRWTLATRAEQERVR